MRYIQPVTVATAATSAIDAEQRYQDYLRISQSAIAIALAARRDAVLTFWRAVASTVRNMGHYPSVRLGAGHNVTRMEAS